MKVHLLGKGSVGCKANVIYLEQDTKTLTNIFLLIAADFPVFITRKLTDPNNSNGCKDFKENRKKHVDMVDMGRQAELKFYAISNKHVKKNP